MLAAECVMPEIDRFAVPELVMVIACTELELPTAVAGKEVVPVMLTAGAPGATGVTPTVTEAGPAPIALIACTEQEYGVPLVRPVTVMGDAVLEPVTGPGVHVAT